MNACDSDETICDSQEEDNTTTSLESSPSLLQGLSRLRTREQTQRKAETHISSCSMSPEYPPPAAKLQRVSLDQRHSSRTRTCLKDSMVSNAKSLSMSMTNVAVLDSDHESLEIISVQEQLQRVEEMLKTMLQNSEAPAGGKPNNETVTTLKSMMATVRSRLSKLNKSQTHQRQQLSQAHSQVYQIASNSEVTVDPETKKQLTDLAIRQREIIILYKKFKELLTKVQTLKRKEEPALKHLLPNVGKLQHSTPVRPRAPEPLSCTNRATKQDCAPEKNSKDVTVEAQRNVTCHLPNTHSNILIQPAHPTSGPNILCGTTTNPKTVGVATLQTLKNACPKQSASYSTVAPSIVYISLPGGATTTPGRIMCEVLPGRTLATSLGPDVISHVTCTTSTAVSTKNYYTITSSGLTTSVSTTKSHGINVASKITSSVIPQMLHVGANPSNVLPVTCPNAGVPLLNGQSNQTPNIATEQASRLATQTPKTKTSVPGQSCKTTTNISNSSSLDLQYHSIQIAPIVLTSSQTIQGVDWQSQTDTQDLSQSILPPTTLRNNLTRNELPASPTSTITGKSSTTTASTGKLTDKNVVVTQKSSEICFEQADQRVSKNGVTAAPRVRDSRSVAKQTTAATLHNISEVHPTYSAPAGRNVLQNGGFLDLKTLIELGHIQPGINVLTIEVEGRKFQASLKRNGAIESTGGEKFHTPLAWLKAVTGSKRSSLKQAAAYKMILFSGRPLASFGTQSVETRNAAVCTSTDSGDGPSQVAATDESQTQDALVNLGSAGSTRARGLITSMQDLAQLLRTCRVIPIADEEFIPTGSILPENFWEVDFDSVNLDQSLFEAF